MCMIYIILVIGAILALLVIYNRMLGARVEIELFKANSNITNQELMSFDYLTNPNYARNILATYYLDDDKKINGNRVVNHPYMFSNNNMYGRYWWAPALSNQIYKSSGVRL